MTIQQVTKIMDQAQKYMYWKVLFYGTRQNGQEGFRFWTPIRGCFAAQDMVDNWTWADVERMMDELQ
jgi:hypothetical protein